MGFALLAVENSAAGQLIWRIAGMVSDSSGTALEMASVYAISDSTGETLCFGRSDEKGIFSLQIKVLERSAQLHVRYLGYKPLQIRINSTDTGFIRVRLYPNKTMLKEVVVSSAAQAIVQKSDTTVYRLASFRDSTEYSVEDVLKKLPGIEVKEDGTIFAKGKFVEKVLIEGSDMFGRKYTIGTKNIRADFIDRVEVIDHYQADPVLKSVNMSESIILNLKMSDAKKNITTGLLNSRLGLGHEPKGALHLNLFSIRLKNKLLLLSDNGNTGSQFGVEEIAATYGNIELQDIKTEPVEIPELLVFPSIQNPGLSPVYIDNGLKYFTTLRSEQNLGKRWKAALNVLTTGNKDKQQNISLQRYLFDNGTYDLTTEESLKFRDRYSEGDLTFQYLSGSQNKSFQSFIKWDGMAGRFNQRIDQYDAGRRFIYDNLFEKKRRSWFSSGLYTQKIGPKGVGQIQVKTFSLELPQNSSTENTNYPAHFGIEEGFSRLSQNLFHRINYSEMAIRYTGFVGRILTEFELLGARSESTMGINGVHKDSFEKRVIVKENDEQSVKSGNGSARLRFLYVKQNTRIGISLNTLARQSFRTDTTLNIPLFNTTSLNCYFTQIFGQRSTLRFSYTGRQDAPPDQHLFTQAYFSDAYTAFTPRGLRTTSTKGHHVSLQFNHKNVFTFQDWSGQLAYDFGQQLWREDIRFLHSIQKIIPYFSPQNSIFTATGRYERFIINWKTKASASVSYSTGRMEYAIEGIAQMLGSRRISTNTNFSFVLVKNFQIGLEQKIQYHTVNLERLENRTFDHQTKLFLLFRRGDWRFSGVFQQAGGRLNGRKMANLTGSTLKAGKEISFFKKTASLEINAINLGNTKQYSQIQSSDYFFFRSEVEAIRIFFTIGLACSF
jgi:CarboxypepD_reg-like domain